MLATEKGGSATGRRTRLREQLEGAIQFLVVAFVFTVAMGSSQVDYANIYVARPARWYLLAALGLAAAGYAALAGRPRRLDPRALAACAFVALCFASAAWSADAHLTLGRAAALLALFGAAGAVAHGTRGRTDAVGHVLLSLLVGAATVAVAGAIVYAINPDRATVPATTQAPERYTGLGGNPNMQAMLVGIGMPLALWALFELRGRWWRAAVAAVLVLFDASLVASGSRGPMIGAFAGVVVFVLACGRSRRWLALGAATAVLVLDVGLTQIPQPAATNPVLGPRYQTTPVQRGSHDAEFLLPIESEIGFPSPYAKLFHRTLLNSSGRVPAWRGALRQAEQRPLLGYGFGTEEKVFADRYYLFFSSLVENSYLGTLLQLGVAGLSLLLVLLGLVIVRGWRGLRRLDGSARVAAAACLGAVACGSEIALTQSYLTSVGSTIGAPFWLCAFLLGVLSARGD